MSVMVNSFISAYLVLGITLTNTLIKLTLSIKCNFHSSLLNKPDISESYPKNKSYSFNVSLIYPNK